MKDSKEMLTAVLHTTQMGQTGIRSVLDNAISSGLQDEMRDQLKEYDAIEKEALRLAAERGWELTNLNPGLRKMSDLMSKAKLIGGEVDSKIAGMLIQGNTRGLILGIKNMHAVPKKDAQITQLAQRLIDREAVNIRKAQPFL